MKLPKFEYLAPQSLGEACRLGAERGEEALLIAGGTDLLQALKQGLKHPRTILDLSSLPGLDQLAYSEQKGLVAGSMITLRRLAAYGAVRDNYPVLAQAALAVGSAQLQAMGTIGGNLCQDACCIYYNLPPASRMGLEACFKLGGDRCHAVKGSAVCWAAYSGDLAPALLVLRTRVTIASQEGERTIPLEELFSGRGERIHTLKPGEIVKEIQIPPPGSAVSLYLKMRVRKSIDYPLLGVAVSVSSDGPKAVNDILIAMTAVEKAPLLIAPPAEIKESDPWEKTADIMAEAAYKKAHPIANTSGYSPRYRKDMVRVYVKRGIGRAMEITLGRGKAS